jgi:hypothetical protein
VTFFGFYRKAAWLSFHFAWEIGHRTHALIIVIAGACVVAGLRFEEHELIAAPFIVLLGSFIAGVLWFAYAIYRDENAKHEEAVAAKKKAIAEVEQRLIPSVEISDDQVERQDNSCVLRIKCLSKTACRFGVDLVAISPLPNRFDTLLPIPMPNPNGPGQRLTNIQGEGIQVVVVFESYDQHQQHLVPPGLDPVPLRKGTYNVTLVPFAEGGASGKPRTFRIENDGMSFTLSAVGQSGS